MMSLITGSVERYLNAQLETSSAARERLTSLSGASLGLRVVGPDLELLVRSDGSRLHVDRGSADGADAVLSGSPIALLELWRKGQAAGFDASGARFSGDAQVLEGFVRLFEHLQPDLEETLAGFTGDIAAHELGRFVRSARSWTDRAVEALLLNTGEYLQEERRALPARHEVEAFFRDVERLRDDTARMEARADRVTSGAAPLDGPDSSTDR